MKLMNLPEGFTLRAATWNDIEAICEMILAAMEADGNASMTVTQEELAQEWKSPGFNLETDAWVVTNPQGVVVGFEEFNNLFSHLALQGDGYVHPNYLGLGIGTNLLKSLDDRAQLEISLAPADMRVFIRNGIGNNEKNAQAIHEEAGFNAVRFSWRMEIGLKSLPAEVPWPEGIELRPFDLDSQNYAIHMAHEDAFRDHWGHTPRSFEQWQNNLSGHPDFDPSLWFIAWDGNQIAGYSLCRKKNDLGWVGSLGVRRPWRKRGLGMALLKHSFRILYKRGFSTIGLGVDASNPTGATRLYERAGMHVKSKFAVYEKEYRAGKEPEEYD